MCLPYSFHVFLCPFSASLIFLAMQEVLPDRKRVTSRSYLPITPVDTDSGSNFTCVASNPAVPMGKRVTVTLNVHRMLPLLHETLLGFIYRAQVFKLLADITQKCSVTLVSGFSSPVDNIFEVIYSKQIGKFSTDAHG